MNRPYFCSGWPGRYATLAAARKFARFEGGRIYIYGPERRFPWPVETWIDGKKQTPEIIREIPAAHIGVLAMTETDRAAAIAAWSEYQQLEKPIDVTPIRGGSQ